MTPIAMNTYIESHQKDFESAIEFLRRELSTIRTGRAHGALVEDIPVSCYGGKTPLKQLASITVPDARSLLIQPWDRNIIKDIEKAMRDAQRGFNPVNEGDKIRVILPQLTESDRRELVKILHQKLEQARIKIRLVRDRVKESIISAERNGEISEDERYAFLKELDNTTQDYNQKIKSLGEKKEKEITSLD